MKNYLLILILGSLIFLGMETNIMAQQDESWIELRIEKSLDSDGEFYDFDFDFDGIPINMDILEAFLLITPGSKWTLGLNRLLTDDFTMEAEEMSLADLEGKFPEGNYWVVFLPQFLGFLHVNVHHNFPQTPVITYPVDGATSVSLNPTFTWNPIGGINGLALEIEIPDESFSYRIGLPTNATSYAVPNGFLRPNTNYELYLAGSNIIDNDPYPGVIRIVGGMNSELISSRSISFTTGS